MAHPDMHEEKRKLNDILEYMVDYNVGIVREKELIDSSVAYSLKHFNSDNAEQFTELSLNIARQDYLSDKVTNVSKALMKPYFARVDFTPGDDKILQKLYIGKLTLMRDEDNTILITDWRAPVSTLYYEGRLGSASYECEEGIISGEITLKRQYAIEDGELLNITDIDITTNDEFLQAALGSSKDRRLKDIVTTIQAEQNKIIRAPMFKPLIVQGAAGGGKTTIALHRIAYLLYTYENKIKPKNIMIIAPSRFFLSYISEVLPDLGVERVMQTTFEDYAMSYIDRRLKLKPASDKIAAYLVNNDDTILQASHLKSSLEFKTIMKKYINAIIYKIIPRVDFELEGYQIISQKEIERLFLSGYKHLPAAKRVDEIKKNLTNALKREKPRILELIDRDYDDLKNKIKREMPDGDERRSIIIKLLDERDEKLKAVTNRSKTAVRNYLRRFNMMPPEKYYIMLMSNEKLFIHLNKGIYTEEQCKLIVDRTMENVRNGFLEAEDLPPIMMLAHELYGTDDKSELSDIRHIVIDEVQDFSMFQLSILKEIAGNQSFSILGDLSQGIYSYKGVDNWDDVLAQVFDENPNYLTLEQSYRTTVEIMDAANSVIKCLNRPSLPLAKPVIRHGSPVSIYEKSSLREAAGSIDGDIERFKKEGYQSVAVICKTLPDCRELKALLKNKANIITGGEKDFAGGVNIIPSYLVKGLEFDAVLIANADYEKYARKEMDIKLLYVAMTRALHELVIYACGRRSELLDGM